MFFLTAPHIIARVGKSLDPFDPSAELARLTREAQSRLAAARAPLAALRRSA